MKQKTIYALGFFDGVHVGHQALLAQCRRMADSCGSKAGVVTFTSHPDSVVYGKAPVLINTSEDRKRLLTEQYRMDAVVELPFNKQMMSMPWQTFLRMLRDECGADGFVCGEDFRFGYRGEGSAEILRKYCRVEALPCAVVPACRLDGVTVSSTHIRGLIAKGAMEEAVRFLGHPHVLTGTVVPGKQLGRTIGIPTANLDLPEGIACPRFGVYACRACFDGQRYLAVTNVGVRPTVSGSGITVEPWLLDFEGDLYGRQIALEFHAFLRPERKFDSLDQLRQEIFNNAEETRKFFAKK